MVCSLNGPLSTPHLQLRPCLRSCADQTAALQVLEEYKEVGAVEEVSLQGTQFLVPWFVIKKSEGEGQKLRLDSDCREINQQLQSQHFKLDHWQHIFPVLKKAMWACKKDLKQAYFHLGLSEGPKPFIRMNVGDRIFHFKAACFGLNTLPQQ